MEQMYSNVIINNNTNNRIKTAKVYMNITP